MDLLKPAFAMGALALTFAAFIPYFRAIMRDETRPHVLTWIIWGVGTIVVFLAQLSDGGALGAWVIGVSGLLTLAVALVAWTRHGDTSIEQIDWLFLLLAVAGLAAWLFADSPLAAVIILTLVDLLGFGPSVRKAYRLPHEENITFFAIGALRNAFVLLALGRYTWITVVFPAAIGLACLLFVLLIVARRRMIGRPDRLEKYTKTNRVKSSRD